VLKVLKDLKVLKEVRVLKGEPQELKEQQVHKVPKEQQVHKVL
jgi:hypothetical protein